MTSQRSSPATTPSQSLHLAIKALQPDLVETLIKEKADVLSKQPEPIRKDTGIPQPITPLALAAKNPDGEASLAILSLLLKAGVQVKKDPDALWAALDLGRVKMVEALLNANADPNLSQNDIWSRKTYPLNKAINNGEEEIVNLLLDAKAVINNGDVEAAAEKGHGGIVEVLLNKKATVYSHGALGEAVTGGDKGVVRRFIEAKVDVNSAFVKLPLRRALISQNFAIAEMLIEAKADAFETLFSMNAREKLSVEQARPVFSFLWAALLPTKKLTASACYRLLKERIDVPLDRIRAVDEPEKEENFPEILPVLLETMGTLHDLRPMQEALDYAIQQKDLRSADILDKFILKKRKVSLMAGLSLPTVHGLQAEEKASTPVTAVESKKTRPGSVHRSIREAIEALDLPAVNRFLETGSKPNLEINRELPLVTAVNASLERRALPVVQALLTAKAHLDKPQDLLLLPIKSGRTDILKALLEARADPNTCFKKEIKQPPTMSIRYGEIPGEVIIKQETLLEFAIKRQDEKAVNSLLKSKAVVGNAELIAASSRDNGQIMAALLKANSKINGLGLLQSCIKGQGSIDVLRQLIASGANINESVHEQTPLVVAVICNCPAIAKILLVAKAQVNTTILDYLSRHSSFDASLISELITAKADINTISALGYTPLQTAVTLSRSLPLASALLEAKASAHFVSKPKRGSEEFCSALELAYQCNIHQSFINALEGAPRPISALLHNPLEQEELPAPSAVPVLISAPVREEKKASSVKKAALPHTQSLWTEMSRRSSHLEPQIMGLVWRLADMPTTLSKK